MNWFCIAVPAILGILSALHPAFGIALFLASIPALAYFLQSPFTGFSVITLGALFVAVGTVTRLMKGRAFELSWANTASLAFLGACFVSAAVRFSEILLRYPSLLWRNLLASDQLNPFVFIGETAMWTIAVIFYVVLRSVTKEEKQLRIIYNGLLAEGIVFLAVTAWDIVRFSKPFPGYLVNYYLENQPGWYGVFSEHNSFAVFCMIQLCLLLGGLQFLRGAARIVAALLLVANTSLILLSLSLSTLLAAGVVIPAGVLLVFFRRWRSRLAFALCLLMLVAGGALAYSRLAPSGQFQAAVDQKLSSVTPSQLWTSISELRLYPWLVSINMIKDFPILGLGPGRFYQSFPEYRPAMDPGPLWGAYSHENAHNYYLQVGAEMGLIGLVILLAFVVWTLVRAGWQEPIRASAGLAFAAVAVTSLLQHPLLEELLFFGFLAVAAIAPAPRPGSAATRVSSHSLAVSAPARKHWVEVAAGCLALLFVIHVVEAWAKMPRRVEWGVYGIERGDKEYRWTSRLAVINPGSLADRLSVEFQAHNPDIQDNPLQVTVEQAGKQIGRLELHDHDWHPLTVRLTREQPIAIRTSRTFHPPGEVRELGVAVSGLP